MFMFIHVEDKSMNSVVSPGVTGWVELSLTAHGITGSIDLVSGAISYVFTVVTSMLPIRFSVGSAIYVLKYLRLTWYL